MKFFITVITYSVSSSSFADDIQPLGDEFTSAVTQSTWSRLNDTEGWNADQLERWDFNPDYAPGHMVMAPYSSAWFMDLRGVLAYKEIPATLSSPCVSMQKAHESSKNRYTQTPTSPYQQLPNFGDTLQVGITTYTDWNSIGSYCDGGNHASQFQHNYSVLNGPSNNPDLIAEVDCFRFQRPDATLTQIKE
ncbi:MAG: hypothetical protein ACSHXG_15595 [Maribacter stanieri]